ncbi:MAG TPA: DUF4129 domain-containing protein [Pyrinomonadaceae bacterium]|nr:DUF4129 domain-containing protein [Pyrinomonadaceae bacterium]
MTRPSGRTSRRAPRALASFLLASLCCFVCAPQRADAASLEDYRARVQTATTALEGLHQTFDETGDVNSPEFIALETRTFQEVRDLLPAREKIEGAGVAFDVDNRWLHDELDLYPKIAPDETGERDELLLRVSERLRALHTRLAEAAVAMAARDKEAEKGRLNAILQRREYNEQAAEDTALSRLREKFKSWLRGLLPQSSPLGEEAAGTFSVVARLFVFALTAAVVIYVLWKYGAQLLPRNRARKKVKSEARVVLGERLAPGQTPADLVEQAESLARAGDLRGAIRKAYIAVLVELGERRILRLAAHKTNRDYLSALRQERAALYGDMQPLTHNYERHWYGFAPATDADWHDFRSRCRQAIKVSS